MGLGENWKLIGEKPGPTHNTHAVTHDTKPGLRHVSIPTPFCSQPTYAPTMRCRFACKSDTVRMAEVCHNCVSVLVHVPPCTNGELIGDIMPDGDMGAGVLCGLTRLPPGLVMCSPYPPTTSYRPPSCVHTHRPYTQAQGSTSSLLDSGIAGMHVSVHIAYITGAATCGFDLYMSDQNTGDFDGTHDMQTCARTHTDPHTGPVHMHATVRGQALRRGWKAHARTHARTHTHTHTHEHQYTHTHTHTHARTSASNASSSAAWLRMRSKHPVPSGHI